MQFDPFSNVVQMVASEGSVVLVLFVLFLLAVFWIWQFVHLMTFREDAFPWKFDKALWAAALLVGNLAGAIAFWFWKHQMRNDEPTARRRSFDAPTFSSGQDEPPSGM